MTSTPLLLSSLLPRPRNALYLDPLILLSEIANTQPVISNTKTSSNATSIVAASKIPADKVLTISSITETEHDTYESTIPLKQRFPNLIHHFPRPEPDLDAINETKLIFQELLDKQLGLAEENGNQGTLSIPRPGVVVSKRGGTYAADPMLPPKLVKLAKNKHQRPENPPAPILKLVQNNSGSGPSPVVAGKLSKEERAKWEIPAAISNWKNNNGFTIGLEKRMIGKKRGLDQDEPLQDTINIDKFAALSSALLSADAQAREDIRRRNEERMESERLEQMKREERIREIANRSKRRRY